MQRKEFHQRRGSVWRRLLGVCCILLVLIGSSVELTHSHPSGQVNPECSLCVVAHSAAQVTVFTVAALVLRPVAQSADPEPLVFHRNVDIRLSIRPPPVAPAFA
jgi:hypothetical protein